MRLASQQAHLTYCTNVHAGETWEQVFDAVDRHVPELRRRLCPEGRFGIGLRLSALATQELARPEALGAFRRYLEQQRCYVFTLNGFPYGRFHGQRVKEHVYRPDWLEEERLVYTDRLAHILAELLPRDMPGLEGSISTVPGCFRARAANRNRPAVEQRIAEQLLRHVATLVGIAAEGGPTLGLALEPEPACLWETLPELVAFFEQHIFSAQSTAQLAELTGRDPAHCEDLLRRHLGVCLDACHAAVEFEQVDEVLSLLRRAGVRVLKLQVTTGLRLTRPTERALSVLEEFADGVYLHQTRVRHGDQLSRHLDLPDALREARARGTLGDEWRVHFHVPVFESDLSGLSPGFENTHAFLRELLAHQAREPLTQHLEVETYTWDVLPRELRSGPVEDAIERELRWTLEQLQVDPSTACSDPAAR